MVSPLWSDETPQTCSKRRWGTHVLLLCVCGCVVCVGVLCVCVFQDFWASPPDLLPPPPDHPSLDAAACAASRVMDSRRGGRNLWWILLLRFSFHTGALVAFAPGWWVTVADWLRGFSQQTEGGRGPRKIEDARLRPIRLRTIRLRPTGRSRNWPKSKLADVEIDCRSRTDWCLLFLLSLFLFSFALFSHLSLHFVSVLFLFSSPKT